MRISDWSSDVCSSDLLDGLVVPEGIDAELGVDAILEDGDLEREVAVAQHPPAMRATLIFAGCRLGFGPLLGGGAVAAGREQGEGEQRDRPQIMLLAHRAVSMVEMRAAWRPVRRRSEEHTSELPSLMRISYAVFC